MLDKKLADIQEKDLQELVTNSVAESKTLEFKRELPAGSDDDKREFLADASSFANSAGGDILYGVLADKGIAKEIQGLDSVSLDDVVLRWEGVLRTALDPRMQYEFRSVPLVNGCSVLILRVPKSWTGPHRVTYKSCDKFYARGAAGKFSMNVGDLRAAFSLSESLAEKIAGFRLERISEISAGRSPISLSHSGAAVVHLIPIESFDPGAKIDLEPLMKHPGSMKPMYCDGWDSRYTYEGYLAYQGGDPKKTRGYIHAYRTGIIEAAISDIVDIDESDCDKRLLFDWMYEQEIPKAVQEYLNLQRSLGIGCPVYVFLTFVGVQGCTMRSMMGVGSRRKLQHPLERDVLQLPGAVIDDWDAVDTGAILQPMFDLVWNACGHPRSVNFNERGDWIAST